MSVVMSFSMLAQVKQVSKTIKACKYFDFLVPAPYSGVPMRAGYMLEISYSSKDGRYGIDYKLGDKRVMVSCRYDSQLSDGRYRYAGIEIHSMRETQVITKEKLNKFLEYYGQEQLSTFEDDKCICVEMAYMGPLYIYPLRNTSELQASIAKRAKEKEKEKREKEELQLGKDTYERLCSYTAKNEFNDRVKAFVLNKILENKSLFEKLKLKELSRKVDCIGCVESTGAIKIVKIGEYFLDDILFKEYSSQDNIRYATREGGKLFKDKAFFKTTFNPNDIEYKVVNYGKIKIVGKDRKVVRNNLRAGYITTDVLDIIDSKRLKKGSYDLYFETIGGKAILIKAKKQINPAVSFTCAISVVLLPVLLIQPKNKVIYDFYD